MLLVWGRVPTWAVFAGTLAAILTLGLAPESEALSGFSNAGVLSVVVLYVVAEGMYRTGAISLIIDRVVGMPGSERAANLRILPVTAVGSVFHHNTPIVAMLVPAVADLGRSAKLAVLLDLHGRFNASVLGGSTTLIGTSTNLIIAGLVLATYGVELRVFFRPRSGCPRPRVLSVLTLLGRTVSWGRARLSRRPGAPKSRYRAEFVVTEGPRWSAAPSPVPVWRNRLAAPAGHHPRWPDRPASPPGWSRRGGDASLTPTIATVGQLWTTLGLAAANPPEVKGDEYATRLVEGVVAVDSPYIAGLASELARAGWKVVAVSRGSAALASPCGGARGGGRQGRAPDGPRGRGRAPNGLALTRRVRGYRVRRTDRAVAAMPSWPRWCCSPPSA